VKASEFRNICIFPVIIDISDNYHSLTIDIYGETSYKANEMNNIYECDKKTFEDNAQQINTIKLNSIETSKITFFFGICSVLS
jgi:hypothetical protein